MHDILNVHPISPSLYTSGQPTEAQLVLVRDQGVGLVVNLALSSSDRALKDERSSVEALGMRYVHIPVLFDAPSEEDYVRFEQTLLAQGAESTWVHCALNYRVSSFVAVYAHRNLGWSKAESDALRTRFWQPDPTWQQWAATFY
jgi:protein tyrosine phosphatase (PTP) superfamily phosphohydrolase (DUF442 family)